MKIQIAKMSRSKIGEVTLNTFENQIIAVLNYQTDQHQSISCIILDIKGCQVWSGKIEISAHHHEAEFVLPSLRPGQYNMWIEVGKRTVIRTLEVKRKPDRRWTSKLKQMFSLVAVF